MRRALLVFMLVSVLAPWVARAQVIVHLGDGVNLHAVNGKAWSDNGFFNSSQNAVLADGVIQLVVSYTVEIGRGSDEDVLETSDTFVLLFKAREQSLTLSGPDIDRRRDLLSFNESPSWKLFDKSGEQYPFKVDVLEKRGFQLSRDYVRELVDFNKGRSPAAYQTGHEEQIEKTGSEHPVDNLNNANISASGPAVKDGESASDQDMVLRMLRYWYRQADESTRSEIKRWIQSGD